MKTKKRKFLQNDEGKKTSNINICCQDKLHRAIGKLAHRRGVSKSTYSRAVLISHVRKQIKKENQGEK